MRLIDTHCHIHDTAFFPTDREAVYQHAIDQGVAMLCVGTSQADSRAAVDFVATHDDAWAIVGVHPHEASDGVTDISKLLSQKPQKIVGIGEIGLDYHYNNSPRDVQIAALEQQLQWACDYELPVSFHVREAFDDFWPILTNFPRVHGVLHSYTDSNDNLKTALGRGLCIGVNGISTFSKTNQDMWSRIPLENLLLETDAPFLTPVPLRGKVNEPAFVRHVAESEAKRRGVALEHLARVTSANAERLFLLKK